VATGSDVYVLEEFYAVILGDALHQNLCACILASESVVYQHVILRSPKETFVLYFVLETSTVCKVSDEGSTPVGVITGRSDILDSVDDQCLALFCPA